MTSDPFTPPQSDAELFEQWYDYVKHLVYKLGIHPQDSADIANDILLRFYEREMLQEYDPELEFEVAGVRRPATFQTFLHGFVALYMRGIRGRYKIKMNREPILCDKPIYEGQIPWVEVFGPVAAEDHSDVEAADLVKQIRAYLVTVPRRSKQDICDLPRLFDLVVTQTWNEGRINVRALMVEFGVSNTAIHSWLRILREKVKTAIELQGYTRTERGWAL